ncbi:MAG: hypothetical protein WAW96_02880, partial [Alphaproteobacteria bacterium]
MKPATPRTLWWLIAVTALALLMAPLFVVELPPLLDYPNHLARQWFLARATDDPILTKFYAPHWAIIPNMAVDLLMIGLESFLPLYAAGKTVLALTIIVQFMGIAIYSRALFGRWSLWSIAGGLISYSAILLLGFVSFLMSLGLALLAAAAWLTWREKHPIATTIGLALAALAIFFVHLLGVAFLGFLIGCRELDRIIAAYSERRNWQKEFCLRALSLLAVFSPSALLYLALVPHQQVASVLYYGPSVIIAGLSIAFSSYSRVLDSVTLCSVFILLALCVRANKAAFTRTTALQLCVLVILYVACPFRFDDEGWLNFRAIYMASLILFAGIAPILPRRAAVAVAGIGAALFCARIFLVADVWHAFNSELASFRQVIAPVAPGSKVVVVRYPPKDDLAYWNATPRARRIASVVPANTHLAALLMIEHRAFWPLLFSVPSQHTIKVLPRYLPLSVPSGELPDYEALTKLTPADLAMSPYLRNWQS